MPGRAEEALPKREAQESPTDRPALFLQNLEIPLSSSEIEEIPHTPNPDVARAQKSFDRAVRKQERWQQLARKGVLAVVEAESAVLQAAVARAKLEQTRVAQQQLELTALRERLAKGEVSADTIAAAESALRTGQAMAAEAASGLQRTRLLLAEANLDRQRRLASAGVGSKAQVKRGEQAVKRLKGEE
ncbi:MAG TPA: hypothetical protein VF593_09270, partial [Chthoniobacteraceae bacterium]|jgi:hypothetical protein